MIHFTKETPNGRGCGHRIPNKPYLCCGLARYGLSIENFIIDPAHPWDIEGHSRGAYIWEKDGINHVIIFIGKTFYASPWDFVEETRHYGISRRIGNNFPFHKLTPGKSNMYFAHSRVLPEFTYTQVSHPEKCKQSATTLVTGFHTQSMNDINVQLDNQKYTRCTFSLKSLSIFHNSCIYNHKNGTYTINHPSFSYTIIPPLTAQIGDNYYHINKNYPKMAYGELKSYGKSLTKAPVQYNNHYGIFMWAPITHIEACATLPITVANKINKNGYEYHLLDY